MENKGIKNVVDFLNSDEEKAKALLVLSPEEACKELNSLGVECAVSDLLAIADGIKKSIKESGELNEADIEIVAGGGTVSFCFGLVCGAVTIALVLCAPW